LSRLSRNESRVFSYYEIVFLNGNDINTVKHCGVENVFIDLWEAEDALAVCLDSKLGIN